MGMEEDTTATTTHTDTEERDWQYWTYIHRDDNGFTEEVESEEEEYELELQEQEVYENGVLVWDHARAFDTMLYALRLSSYHSGRQFPSHEVLLEEGVFQYTDEQCLSVAVQLVATVFDGGANVATLQRMMDVKYWPFPTGQYEEYEHDTADSWECCIPDKPWGHWSPSQARSNADADSGLESDSGTGTDTDTDTDSDSDSDSEFNCALGRYARANRAATSDGTAGDIPLTRRALRKVHRHALRQIDRIHAIDAAIDHCRRTCTSPCKYCFEEYEPGPESLEGDVRRTERRHRRWLRWRFQHRMLPEEKRILQKKRREVRSMVGARRGVTGGVRGARVRVRQAAHAWALDCQDAYAET